MRDAGVTGQVQRCQAAGSKILAGAEEACKTWLFPVSRRLSQSKQLERLSGRRKYNETTDTLCNPLTADGQPGTPCDCGWSGRTRTSPCCLRAVPPGKRRASAAAGGPPPPLRRRSTRESPGGRGRVRKGPPLPLSVVGVVFVVEYGLSTYAAIGLRLTFVVPKSCFLHGNYTVFTAR